MTIFKRAYQFRGILVSPPLLFAIFSFSHEIENDWLIWPLGILTFILGFTLRIWAQQHIHYRLDIRRHLTTTGPYSFVRNPIYIGNTLICLSATILSELLWLIPVTIVWCAVVYSLVVHYEETRLKELYGEEYLRYMLETPRWTPNFLNIKNIKLINQYFGISILAEIHCFLILVPFVLKEIISSWFQH